MLIREHKLLIEQASAKAGGQLDYQPKKSSSKILVYYIRASNRTDARRNVQNFLKTKKISFTEKKTSLSSENITEFVLDVYTVRIGYKPRSGGMTETTLNSTITELVPCLAFLNKITERNPEKLYEKVLALPQKQTCYVNAADQKAGIDFLEDMPKSSKFKEKMNNAVAITKFLEDTHRDKKIDKVYWTYRAKPIGVPANSPADIALFFVDKSILGVSLKAGGESTKEPLLNTYVNKVYFHFEPSGTQIQRLRGDLYQKTYSKIPDITSPKYDEAGAERKKTLAALDKLETTNLQEYEKLYDANLAIIRNKLVYTMTKDFETFKKYCRSEILKQSDVPVTIIKAINDTYKEVKDSNRLSVLLEQATSVEGMISISSKQNFDIRIKQYSKVLGTMNMAVRSNKVGVEHKLGQFFNLAVKYNGLNE
tara:strand:- start:254 stop:1525 length:1272 start_codon:yes stop_codon:yes gene_type:complete